jgi:DNA polymerase-3 subunit gamma/tau
VLEQVKARSRRTRALLDNASIASVDGTVIRLSATSTTIAKMISDDSNLSILRDALSAVVGGGWQIEVAGGSAPSGRPDPSQASSRADPRPYEAQPTTERSAHDDDGVDENSDAVHGTERAGADPEATAIALLKNSLGARSIEA